MNSWRRRRGLSLLEILITLVLISTTLVAFAAVYPASLKLNRRSQKAVQAAELAGAVAEEIRSLPFTAPGLSVDDLPNWDPAAPAFKNFPRTLLPEPYTLVSTRDPNQLGIVVSLTESKAGQPKTFADIVVTVYWQESTNERMLDKSVTIRSSRTANR